MQKTRFNTERNRGSPKRSMSLGGSRKRTCVRNSHSPKILTDFYGGPYDRPCSRLKNRHKNEENLQKMQVLNIKEYFEIQINLFYEICVCFWSVLIATSPFASLLPLFQYGLLIPLPFLQSLLHFYNRYVLWLSLL